MIAKILLYVSIFALIPIFGESISPFSEGFFHNSLTTKTPPKRLIVPASSWFQKWNHLKMKQPLKMTTPKRTSANDDCICTSPNHYFDQDTHIFYIGQLLKRLIKIKKSNQISTNSHESNENYPKTKKEFIWLMKNRPTKRNVVEDLEVIFIITLS